MRLRLPAVVLASLLTGACAAAPPWVSPEEHQRVVRQLLELERRSALAELEIERLKRRLTDLDSAGAVAVKPPALAAQPRHESPDEPAPGWRVTQSPIEESELAEIAAPSGTTSAGSSGYERGLALLRDGRPAESEAALLAFANAEPGSDLADNAWFWIGESRLVRGDSAGAIAAYRSCLERYPGGNKVPDAMLKLGQAFATQGDLASAREVWSELLQRFPSTAAAESARGRLGTPRGDS